MMTIPVKLVVRLTESGRGPHGLDGLGMDRLQHTQGQLRMDRVARPQRLQRE